MSEKKLNYISVIFFVFYIILPSYFAIELNSILPLFTISRIILLLLMLTYCLKTHGKLNISFMKQKEMSSALKLYCIFLIIANLYYVYSVSDAIKDIFTIILEEFCVVWIITAIVDSKEKIEEAFKCMVIGSSIVSILAIISCILGNNVFYYLDTTSRDMLMASTLRMGIIRAEAGFGHPVYYGAYCIIMIPIIISFIKKEKNSIFYIFALILNIIGLFLANSRGSIIAFIILIAYLIITNNSLLIKKYTVYCIGVAFIVTIILLLTPKANTYIINTFISVRNIFSKNPIEISNYGSNPDGLESRTSQISEVVYSLRKNWMFGLGAGANNRGVLMWYNPTVNDWRYTNTFDVGYFAIICQYGIVGSIGYLVLYIGILKTILSKKYKDSDTIKVFKEVFIIFFVLMISTVPIDKLFWVILGLLFAFLNNEKKSKKDENEYE